MVPAQARDTHAANRLFYGPWPPRALWGALASNLVFAQLFFDYPNPAARPRAYRAGRFGQGRARGRGRFFSLLAPATSSPRVCSYVVAWGNFGCGLQNGIELTKAKRNRGRRCLQPVSSQTSLCSRSSGIGGRVAWDKKRCGAFPVDHPGVPWLLSLSRPLEAVVAAIELPYPRGAAASNQLAAPLAADTLSSCPSGEPVLLGS